MIVVISIVIICCYPIPLFSGYQELGKNRHRACMFRALITLVNFMYHRADRAVQYRYRQSDNIRKNKTVRQMNNPLLTKFTCMATDPATPLFHVYDWCTKLLEGRGGSCKKLSGLETYLTWGSSLTNNSTSLPGFYSCRLGYL